MTQRKVNPRNELLQEISESGESLQAAQRQANELTRSQGHLGPTHAERWSAREPIDPMLREQFAAAIERHRQSILTESKKPFDPQNKTNNVKCNVRPSVERSSNSAS